MRAVSILITELLIKTPWYTDQRSMPPSWQEPSSPSPFPWIRKGRSFWFFCPIQKDKIPNVSTIELLMQKQGNLFLLLCFLSFTNFKTSGLYPWIYSDRTGCCEHCSPQACALRLGHTSLVFKVSFCLILSGTERVIASVAKGCVTDANVAHRDKHVTLWMPFPVPW